MHAFMANIASTSSPTEVFSMYRTPSCQEIGLWYKGHTNDLIRVDDQLRGKVISLTTNNQTFKEKFESMQKDIKQLKQDLSDKTCASLYHKQKANQFSNELDILKSKFANANFNFKKFEGSIKKLEQMIGPVEIQRK